MQCPCYCILYCRSNNGVPLDCLSPLGHLHRLCQTYTIIIVFFVIMSCLQRTQPPHISILYFRNVVYARSLSEMCAARHDMVQIACGRAAHTVFALRVAPQMFRCRRGGLSRAHSVGRPPCTPQQRVTTRESFFWVDVVYLWIAAGLLSLFFTLRDTGFCGLT